MPGSFCTGLALVVSALLSLRTTSCHAQVLWYSGDIHTHGLANEINTGLPDSRVYEPFVVTDPAGWHITSLWSNNLTSELDFTQANWSIHQGISIGDGGVIVAGGTNQAIETPTGRFADRFPEETIKVSGLDINLAAGTYWLQVTPIGHGVFNSFVSNTEGVNAVGALQGDDGSAFIDSLTFGLHFASTTAFLGQEYHNFSMGAAGNVLGQAVPEPGSLALLTVLGITGSLFAVRSLRRRKK